MNYNDMILYCVILAATLLLMVICFWPIPQGRYTQIARNIEVGDWKYGFQCEDCYKSWFGTHDPLAPCPFCNGRVDDIFRGRYVRYNGEEYIQPYNTLPDNIITDVAVGHFKPDGCPICPPVRLKGLLRCTNGIGVPRNAFLCGDSQTS